MPAEVQLYNKTSRLQCMSPDQVWNGHACSQSQDQNRATAALHVSHPILEFVKSLQCVLGYMARLQLHKCALEGRKLYRVVSPHTAGLTAAAVRNYECRLSLTLEDSSGEHEVPQWKESHAGFLIRGNLQGLASSTQ